jgi:hypothetical protein
MNKAVNVLNSVLVVITVNSMLRFIFESYMKFVNWWILTSEEIYKIVTKPTITETISLNRLRWFVHV